MSKFLSILAAALLVLTLAGCSPTVICSVETIVMPDYSCRRVVRLDATPHPNYPSQRPRLGEYFQFPPAELYETYLAQPEKAVFAGIFNSYENIPKDLARLTPGSDKVAGNVFAFRVMDLVLVVLADFDETIQDIIVSREDGQAAIAELIHLVVPEVMAVLNARYGGKYELSRLEQWLRGDLVAKLQRIYSGIWNIRMAKRSGVTSPGEIFEVYMFLKNEAKREGLELADLGTPDIEQENIRRLKEFALRKARELCPPRQPGDTPLSPDMLSGNVGDELLGALQKAITARHGSINDFIRKIGALLPRAFGAYLTGDVMPIYMLPDVTYYYRLRVPGMVLQTNGVRDVSGDILWNFADSDLALTGQSMWARTLFVREPVLSALDIKGFPSSLAEVDQLFGLAINASGMPREALLISLQQSATSKTFAPLEALANNSSSPDAASARGVLELLSKYRGQGKAAAPDANPGQQASPDSRQTTPQPAAAQPPAQSAQQQMTAQPQANAQQPAAHSGQPRQAAPAPPLQAADNQPSPARPGQPGHPLAPIQPIETDSTGQPRGSAPPPLPPPVK